MKKSKLFMLIAIVACLSITVPQYVYANLLAECHVCKKSGKCNSCHGSKVQTCNRCKGGGKMPCDCCNGTLYITCHICNGTLVTNGQACVACENGKEPCPSCHKAGSVNCTGCNGTGKMNCTGCQNSDGKCLSCHGTGYLDGQNNGITNTPKNGDTVEKLDGTYITWGSTKTTTKKDYLKQNHSQKNH